MQGCTRGKGSRSFLIYSSLNTFDGAIAICNSSESGLEFPWGAVPGFRRGKTSSLWSSAFPVLNSAAEWAVPDTDILSYKQAKAKRSGAVQCVCLCLLEEHCIHSAPQCPWWDENVQPEMFHRISEGLGGTGIFQMSLLDPKGLEAVGERSPWKFLWASSFLLFCLCCKSIFETTGTATLMAVEPYGRLRAGGNLQSLERTEKGGLKFISSDGCRYFSRA